MVTNIVNLLSRAFVTRTTRTTAVTPVSGNPFANPFVTSASQNRSYANYAQNKPVQGGYFAGYYNGKANIVGKKLFIEA